MSDDSKKDIFITRTIYPEAEAVFTATYKSLEEIKEDCLVVLDTNTLLVPYNIGKESLEKIGITYRSLIDSKRLVIPSQVAREFAKNRAGRLTELYDNFSKKRAAQSNFDTGNYPLLDDVPEYQELLRQQKQINHSVDQYRRLLGKVLEHIQNWFWNDPVSLVYKDLFDVNVIKETSVADDDIKRDLGKSKLHKIPPAYKDAAKDDEGIGDLLIWKTILEVAAVAKKSVLFVSGDEKSDWWYRSHNTPLYPRYELVDEFRRSSDGQTFHIVRFSRFLELFGVDKPAVKEVRQQETALDYWGAPSNLELNYYAIGSWLTDRFPAYIVENGMLSDFVLRGEEDSIYMAVEIAHSVDSANLADKLRQMALRVEEINMDSRRLVILVADDYEIGLELVTKYTTARTLDFGDLPFLVVIGFVRAGGTFAELFSTE